MKRMSIRYDPETDTLNGSTGGESPHTVEGATWHRDMTPAKFQALQVAAYVMAGGGMIGQMYAQQPADAYTDIRAGKRPYRADEVETVRQVLIAGCHALGLNPHDVPMPALPGCWVF